MGQELAGKVAIVSGGAGGLGSAIVQLFLQEGADVVVADVDREAGEALAARLGGSTAFRTTDVSDAQAVQDVVDFAVERFGGLHVMVNNAGISSARPRFLRDDLSDFSRVMGVNLLGVMLGAQRAARYMADHGGGSIVNITSIAGINAGGGLMTYRASKAAVIHVTRSIAIELAEHDVRVNAIAPAHISTPINTDYDIPAVVRLMQPLQRQGTPLDVANAALYLASDRSAQVTGIVLPVDGGTTAGRPVSEVRQLLTARPSEPPS
jgi:NAD(P)-dependent dehydrogenase (short-subunit alcohol dehydrogenase family)